MTNESLSKTSSGGIFLPRLNSRVCYILFIFLSRIVPREGSALPLYFNTSFRFSPGELGLGLHGIKSFIGREELEILFFFVLKKRILPLTLPTHAHSDEGTVNRC